MKENPVPASTIGTPSAAPETAMLDVDTAMAKKSFKRKKHSRVINVLKESVWATRITKRILDLRVNFTAAELLASTPSVEKQLLKVIPEDEAHQFRVNTLSSAEGFEAISPYSWYFMVSLQAKVCLEDSSKVTALLNTGAEINVIT